MASALIRVDLFDNVINLENTQLFHAFMADNTSVFSFAALPSGDGSSGPLIPRDCKAVLNALHR